MNAQLTNICVMKMPFAPTRLVHTPVHVKMDLPVTDVIVCLSVIRIVSMAESVYHLISVNVEEATKVPIVRKI